MLARDSTIVRSWRHIALVSILRSSYALDAPLTSLSPSRRLTGGSAPGGALRGGRGCRRVRQAEIDDRERHRRGAALSCRVTRPACGGAGRSVPARHLPVAAGGPGPAPGIEPVSAVDLQGRLGCGALGARALGRKQEGPSDSPSRAPRHLVYGPGLGARSAPWMYIDPRCHRLESSTGGARFKL